jgi:Tol biopolymer transport system component
MGARAVTESIIAMSFVLAAPGLLKAQESKPARAPQEKVSKSSTIRETSAQMVARLVEHLKRHPVEPKESPDRVGLYLMDLTNGDATLLADQPVPGLTHCGSATWSHDGRRILFDATPGTQWSLTRLKSIDLRAERPNVTDLGTGNCPTFSPTDDRIAFLSNADGVEMGVWLMQADGSDRRLLGDYGKPMWSPDGRQLMIMSFSRPRQVTLMDANPARSGVLQLPGHQIYADPSWAGEGTIVAVIGPTEGDTVALIDVSDPSQAHVKEILWRKSHGPDVLASYPVYSASTRRCIFVGSETKGMALYSVQQGRAEAAKPLGSAGHSRQISSLAISPDGRYLLYSVHGPAAPAKKELRTTNPGSLVPADEF